MDRNFREGVTTQGADASPPSEAWLLAQALLGKAVPSPSRAAADTQAKREHLEWLAQISSRHEQQLRRLSSAAAEARRQREHLEWLAKISSRHESQLRRLLAAETEAKEAQARFERLVEGSNLREAQWDSAKHPRGAFPQNRGWWSPTSWSLFDAIVRRNAAVAELTGVVTPSMIRSSRLAAELESAARLPGEVARAAAAGLVTGGKAVVNSFATAVKNVATLGLSASQLELIGVTREDRDRGYDTAVAISTASGQVLIAVGTGGMASALSKGGSVARAASGALIAYDAAGNAVGVVQGVYDATQNGVTIANGVKVAAGALGLGANFNAARGLKSSGSTKQAAPGKPTSNVDEFAGTLPRKTTPTKSAANQYEIKHAGPYNYTVSGGGEAFDIDGYRGSTILEAKHVDKPTSSPYVPGSSCLDKVRSKVMKDTRDELRRVRTLIESRSTPFTSVEIITNSPDEETLRGDAQGDVCARDCSSRVIGVIDTTMHNLLLFDRNERPLSVDALDRIFRSVAGFGQVRYNTPIGTPIEADYDKDGDFTTVRLDSERETISISGTSDAALQAAWILRTQLETPLRIVDTDYSFDLVLNDFKSFEELQAAIDSARAG